MGNRKVALKKIYQACGVMKIETT